MNAIATPSSAPQATPRAVAISGLGDAADVGAVAETTTRACPVVAASTRNCRRRVDSVTL
jgi:hypothetical protein